MDSLTKQRLVLIQSHQQEWQTFFMVQIALRRSLGRQHEKERANQTPCEYAKLVYRQACEVMEFRAFYSEKKWRIREDQSKAIAVLEESFRLNTLA